MCKYDSYFMILATIYTDLFNDKMLEETEEEGAEEAFALNATFGSSTTLT